MNANDTENFFKATCTNCGVNVETPNELYDQSVNCPECKNSFLARPNEKIEQPARRVGFAPFPKKEEQFRIHPMVWLIGALIIGFAVLSFFYSKYEKDFFAMTGGIIGGVLGLILLCIAVMITVLWIIFPVFVYFGMSRQEKILKQIEVNSRRGN